MALRRIGHRSQPLFPAPRVLFSTNPPFPPPPPPSTGPDASQHPSSSPPNPSAPRTPTSSPFRDIRDRLRSSSTPSSPRRIPINPPRPNLAGGATSTEPRLEDIRQMLDKFRGSAGAPSPPGPTASFADLYKTNYAQAPSPGKGSLLGFDGIRESLKNLKQPPSRFLTPQSPIFAREQEKNAKGGGLGAEEDKDSPFTLKGTYNYEDLGKRLEELRPAGAAKDDREWFSLEELQGRIAKLVELEKQQKVGQFADLRRSITSIGTEKKPPLGPGSPTMLTLVASLGQDKEYLRLPPQEELVERYFHPDHMSSEEKMKLELQRVRDEFKMSENDCGSARVQIAQLTLKIKHLSAVLHKKDKHSRKGLQEMVQRRKKYLKYLRRTDWDSYCLVLSKLGLRDVPEYKAPDYKSKPTTKAKSKKSKSKKKKRKMKA